MKEIIIPLTYCSTHMITSLIQNSYLYREKNISGKVTVPSDINI